MIPTSGIYKIQSIIHSDKCYVGSAMKMDIRRTEHLRRLKKNRHPNKKLQNHYNKYGELDLQFSALIGCPKEDLIIHEQFFIDAINPWFNICKRAGNTLGVKGLWSEETRKRFSEYRKLNSRGEKNNFYHKHHSEETKLKMKEHWNRVRKAQSPYKRSKRPAFAIKISGENNPNSKLTQLQINEIAAKYKTGNYKRKELAIEYGVSIDTIYRIHKVFNRHLPYKNRISQILK